MDGRKTEREKETEGKRECVIDRDIERDRKSVCVDAVSKG